MVQGTFPVTIDAAPAVVWPWIATLERQGEWSTKPYTVEWTSGVPNAVGSRYRSVGSIPGDKHHVNEGEITEIVPNERLVLRADDPLGPFWNTYTLRPAGNGTEVTYEIRFPELHGMPKFGAPVLFAILGKPDTRKRMQLLKRKVEGGA